MLGEIKSIYRKYESLEISHFFSEACEENWKNCGRIVGRIVKQNSAQRKHSLWKRKF